MAFSLSAGDLQPATMAGFGERWGQGKGPHLVPCKHFTEGPRLFCSLVSGLMDRPDVAPGKPSSGLLGSWVRSLISRFCCSSRRELHGANACHHLPFGQAEGQQALQPTALGQWGQCRPGLFCSLELGLALLFILSRPLVSEPCPACLGCFAVGLQGLMEPQKPDLFTGSPQAGPKGPLTERGEIFPLCA